MNDKYEKASTLMPGPISKEWDINKVRRQGKASRNVIFSDMLPCESGKNIRVIPYICEVPNYTQGPRSWQYYYCRKMKGPHEEYKLFHIL